ncbi:MAG: hypothetical protein WAL04_08300, partial [Acidimicrobiales bacterium]
MKAIDESFCLRSRARTLNQGERALSDGPAKPSTPVRFWAPPRDFSRRQPDAQGAQSSPVTT